MELNWSTFVLEILNFLILVWILKHFFYAPVMGVIERRRKDIEESLSEAERKRREADEIEEQCQARLDEWEAEKRHLREALQQELKEERERRLKELKTTVENERLKIQVLEDRRLEDERRRSQADALAHAGEFIAKLLRRLSGPQLEARLFDMLMEDLPGLPEDCCESLRSVCEEPGYPVRVASAYALSGEHRQALQKALSELVGCRVNCDFAEDGDLIAGLRINIGPLVLRANLQDELQFFVEAGHGQS